MNTEDLSVTAELARLELSLEDFERLGNEVARMIEYFSKMAEVDVSGLEPTTHSLLSRNRVRRDAVARTVEADSLLESAPELEDRFIVIPNVL